MARYDRLADLPLPSRDDAFDGWHALRDLAGRERDADLARRLRLHFLMLRVLYRRLRYGPTAHAAASTAQVERLREELGTLPARDPQRALLSDFLTRVTDPQVAVVIGEAVSLATRSLDWQHYAAAEDYALCGLELARRHGLPRLEVHALRVLARICARLGRCADAQAYAQRATALALQIGDRQEWARAMVDASLAAGVDHGSRHATAVLQEIVARAREWDDGAVGAIAGTALSEHAVQNGAWPDALRHAWEALPLAETLSMRMTLLEHVAVALTRLGVSEAADHAYALLLRHAAGAERPRLLAARARLHAESGNTAKYRELARQISNGPLAAEPRLDLAHAALAAGDSAAARRHAAVAAATARSALELQLAAACTELLAQLDQLDGAVIAVVTPLRQSDPGAARIATEVMMLGESLSP